MRVAPSPACSPSSIQGNRYEVIHMTGEELLKLSIKERYGSVLNFSKAVQIPESSIRNIFTRGLDSVSAGVIVKICQALDLDVESLMSGALSVRPNLQKDALLRQALRSGGPLVDDQALMFALWGDDSQVDAADLEDVKRYATFVAERKKGKQE